MRSNVSRTVTDECLAKKLRMSYSNKIPLAKLDKECRRVTENHADFIIEVMGIAFEVNYGLF